MMSNDDNVVVFVIFLCVSLLLSSFHQKYELCLTSMIIRTAPLKRNS